MSDHEFEKKVHQKMDDLKLRPSEGVWAEVERNLRREKRRRRTLLWLPLMGLLLTAGGYLIFTGNGNTPEQALANSQASEQKATPKETVPATETAKASTTPNSSTTKKIDQPSLNNSTQKADQSNKIKTVTTQQPVAKENNNLTAPKNNSSIARAKNVKQRANKKDKDISNDLDAVTVNGNRKAKAKSIDKTTNDKKDATEVNDDNDVVVPVTVSDNDTKVTSDKPAAAKPTVDSAKTIKANDTAAKKAAAPPAIVKATPKKKDSKASKFQWGVNVNGGIANIIEGNLFQTMQLTRVEDLTDAGPSFAGIPPVPSPEPSTIKRGPAFSVGGFVQTNLSKRFTVSAGLQYSYVSVNTRVGKRVDSMVAYNYGTTNSQVTNSYYRGDNTMHDYMNRYHFLELPISTSLRVTGSKLPISVDAGITFSRLMNTNALHYDGIGRVYYENDDFFRKSQISLNAGLSVGFLQKSKHPVSIGPNFRYFTTALLQDGVSASAGKQHIWSYGLNAKMLLKK